MSRARLWGVVVCARERVALLRALYGALCGALCGALIACSSAPPKGAPHPHASAVSATNPEATRPKRDADDAPTFTPEGLSAHISGALAAHGCGESGALLAQMGDMVEGYIEEGGAFLSYLARLPSDDMRVRMQRSELIADFSSQVMRRHELLEVIARACPIQRPALLERRERLAQRLNELTRPSP